MSPHTHDTIIPAAKAAPVAGYLTAYFSDWTVGDVAAVLAAIYSVLMIGDWIGRKVVTYRRRRAGVPIE